VTIADVPVALLAGGLATRLGPITARIPKALVEVAGRPFVDHQLALLARKGICRLVLCVGHMADQIEKYLGSSAYGIDIVYARDGDCPLGTAGALQRSLPLLGDVFWVMYGDSYMDIDYGAVLSTFLRSGALGLMTVIANHNRWDRSNVLFADGRLLRYDKRRPSPEMCHIDYGVALLRSTALMTVPSHGASDLADLYQRLVDEGQMVGYEVTQRFYEVGSPAGLEETRAHLQSRAG
jgi:prepilin-type processing-associated H-X9-DG protein